MWKKDPKGKCTYKYKHGHTHTYIMFSAAELFEEMREEREE
jgi:hypothetical protein